jgi:hypothetical protein
MDAMEVKSPPKLLDILRSTLWLVEYYDDPNQISPAVIELKGWMKRAIVELEVQPGKDPVVLEMLPSPSARSSVGVMRRSQPTIPN